MSKFDKFSLLWRSSIHWRRRRRRELNNWNKNIFSNNWPSQQLLVVEENETFKWSVKHRCSKVLNLNALWNSIVKKVFCNSTRGLRPLFFYTVCGSLLKPFSFILAPFVLYSLKKLPLPKPASTGQYWQYALSLGFTKMLASLWHSCTVEFKDKEWKSWSFGFSRRTFGVCSRFLRIVVVVCSGDNVFPQRPNTKGAAFKSLLIPRAYVWLPTGKRYFILLGWHL